MATNGNYGRFSERIKKIAFRRKKKKASGDDLNNKLVYNSILKVLAAIPDMVYSNIHIVNDNSDSKITEKTNNNLDKNDLIAEKTNNNLDKNNILNEDNIKKRQNLFYRNKNNEVNKTDSFDEEINTLDDMTNIVPDISLKNDFNKSETVDQIQLKKLEKEILDIIKKKLVLSINNLEILQSELYILGEVNGDAKTSLECQKQINEIKNLLNRVNILKEQYDFLRDNYDFEYLMALDDDNLIDKIIELKNMLGNNQIRTLVKDYKLLEEYKYLYLKIDKLQSKMYDFEENRQKQLDEFKERDYDYEILKNKVYDVDYTNDLYNKFIKEQDEMISELDKNISKINSYEQVNYHLKNFNKLFLHSFKYFGLFMLSPLKGIFPAIAAETLITRNMVKNLYNNVKWEEERKTIYEAIDYSSLIDSSINEMENASNIIDMTLSDIALLKLEYNNKFKDYSGNKDIIQKINDMENKILGNKIKIEIIKNRALQQKKENNKKLILVDKLNIDEQK